jgi:hypothetical protein
MPSAAPRPKPHPLARPRRPQGQPTRGKTAANRLRRVDTLILRFDPALLLRSGGAWTDAPVVDLGYGREPLTTLELWRRLRGLNPTLPVAGVEIDPERVDAALPYAQPGLTFHLGGFNLPVQARLVRAFNVLRQYAPKQVAPAYGQLAAGVLPGGLLVEGTSDPLGRLWVSHLLRRAADDAQPWVREALVFGTNFHGGVEPSDFQAVLPRDLIQRVTPGDPLHDFFAAWRQAAQERRAAQVWGQRAWFAATAVRLGAMGYALELRSSWLRKGCLIWRGSGGDKTGAAAVIDRCAQ